MLSRSLVKHQVAGVPRCVWQGDLDPGVCTVFLMPPREIAEVSSSMVKGLIGPAGWEKIVRKYVPAPVFKRLKGRKR
jgi:pantetheine-phosphate adenylyltransferase